MITVQIEDTTVEVDGREVTISRKGSVVSTTLSPEDAINIVMELSGSFPAPVCGPTGSPIACSEGCC